MPAQDHPLAFSRVGPWGGYGLLQVLSMYGFVVNRRCSPARKAKEQDSQKE